VKRALDLLITLFAGAIFIVPAVALTLVIRATSPGPILYWSPRVGRHGRIFTNAQVPDHEGGHAAGGD